MAQDFIIADVFTAKAFGGNQLAVFPDARGISDEAMQAYAREINFAETTYVLPPEKPAHAFRVRIFTPRVEVPFAGHPTVGTAAVLAHLGLLKADAGRVVLEEKIGPVAVEIDHGRTPIFTRLVLDADIRRPDAMPDRKNAAAALSLQEKDVADAWFAGVGIPFCLVHVCDREAVDRALLDRAAWSSHFAQAWAAQLFFFAGDPAPGSALYARMFAPAFGIEEDPATGSACATLAGTLAERLPEQNGEFAWTVDQGLAMGRPSRIEASAVKADGRARTVKVGGSTVIIGEGRMMVAA